MKSTSYLKLLGIGAIAFSTVLTLSQPSFAKRPRVTVTTPSTSSGTTVVPIAPTTTTTTTTFPGVSGFPSGAPNAQCGPVPVGGSPCGGALQPPIQISNRDYFFCGQSSQGSPTTFVNTPTGNISLIRWVSHYFNHSGYNPTVRCQEVSQRFNRFYNQGILNFVTTGIVNNQPVVCVASEMGGPCQGVLFTLKSGQNVPRTIQQLFDVRVGASGPLFESESREYLDMRPYTQALR
ncbi:MAG: hypothetical protein DCF22_03685 [Leptolyngbya sp.]|nr:MAG: hypothetical protein DCF22_03685 [Leptolyngbya sp.]